MISHMISHVISAFCTMSSRRSNTKELVPTVSPEKPEKPKKRGRNATNEVEAAASDAAKEIADIEESIEPTPTRVQEALLKRRLEKSHTKIEKLKKEKADMVKKMAELMEEAKAAKISKVVESASPGAVVHIGRQVISCLFPSVFTCQN